MHLLGLVEKHCDISRYASTLRARAGVDFVAMEPAVCLSAGHSCHAAQVTDHCTRT